MTDRPTGDGEMARRPRVHDGAATPLGSIESSSPTLLALVDRLLAHGFPMMLLRRPDLIRIYNDGDRQIPGDRHPCGFDQPTFAFWPETFEAAGPIVERARAGQTVSLRDTLFRVSRTGTAGQRRALCDDIAAHPISSGEVAAYRERGTDG